MRGFLGAIGSATVVKIRGALEALGGTPASKLRDLGGFMLIR
jgi:hypothetical protein